MKATTSTRQDEGPTAAPGVAEICKLVDQVVRDLREDERTKTVDPSRRSATLAALARTNELGLRLSARR